MLDRENGKMSGGHWMQRVAYLIDQKGSHREIYSLAFFNEKQVMIDMRKLLEPAIH